MNEAQLDREIKKYSRRVASNERSVDKINNSSSIKTAERMFQQFPGGPGGSAVNKQWRNSMNRYGNAVTKLSEAKENLENNRGHLEALQKAKNMVKGTGKSVNEYKADKVASGGTLGSKWGTTTEVTGYGIFGHVPQKVYRNGSYSIMKPHAYAYSLFNNGKHVGDYNTLKEAKAQAQKMAK